MLKQRVLTALALGLVLLGVVLGLPSWATVLVLSVMVLAGAWEWAGFVRADSLGTRAAFVLLLAATMAFVLWRGASPNTTRWVLLVAMLWWAVAFVWIVAAPARVAPLSAALAGILALLPAWFALVYLCLNVRRGAEWALFTLIVTWAADTGAYFAGRAFGSVPLAPRVSPKKTWEGAIGGVIASTLFGIAGAAIFKVQLGPFVALCAGVGACSIVGDLTESMLKRAAGLKDSGWLFPGHGGVLDRIDSVTAAAPAFVFGLFGLGIIV
jgi:phosphatidate cytidylyltransferase